MMVNTYNITGWGHKGGGSGNQADYYGGGGGGAHSPGLNGTDINTTTIDQQDAPLTSDRSNYLGGVGKYYANFAAYGDSGHFASGGTGSNYGLSAVFSASTKAHRGGGGFGDNSITSQNASANGKPNTGGGAGSGGHGGSGIVLIRY